jgi:hypothetical protein
MVAHLEDLFPGLRGSEYGVTSRQDDGYNCIAWAAGATNTTLWWWPLGDPQKTYWPEGVPRQQTLEAFQQLFEGLGYTVCNHAEAEPPQCRHGAPVVALVRRARPIESDSLIGYEQGC